MEINVLSTTICFEVWFLESREFAPFLREDIFLATRKSVKPKENGKKKHNVLGIESMFLGMMPVPNITSPRTGSNLP